MIFCGAYKLIGKPVADAELHDTDRSGMRSHVFACYSAYKWLKWHDLFVLCNNNSVLEVL